MTDQERYRAAFAVRAPEGAVRRALGKNSARPRRRKAAPRMLLAAALVEALLVTSVSAEIDSGAVTNLLAPMFGSARTELLEEIGRPVGAVASADGYTITAEAITGDRHSLSLTFSIVREDGQPIPEHASFFSWGADALDGGGSAINSWEPDPDDLSRARLYQSYSVKRQISRTIKVSFAQLYTGFDETNQPVVVAEGPWELSFTRRYPDTTQEISAKGMAFTDASAHEYTISKLTISALGFYVKGTLPYSEDEPTLFDLSAYVTLADGTTVEMDDDSLGLSSSGEDRPVKFHWMAYYQGETGPILISPKDIVSITLCGTTIPID